MNTSEKPHLSADTIEDAVLERLSPDEKARVESHLRDCSRCRQAFEQELLIAAGTKIWARAAMKQKLAGHIAAAAQRRVPWPQVLGAAALLVVIVGVGVLFRWREPVMERDLAFSDTAVSDALTQSVPSTPAPSTEAGKMTVERKLNPPPHDDRERDRQDKKDVSSAYEQTRVAAPEMEEKAKEAEPPVTNAALAEAVGEPAGLDVWLGGTEVSNALSGGIQAQPAGASNQGVSLNRLEARKGVRKTESAMAPVFVIDQRARTTLHDARAANEPQDIPTHVVRRGDTLRVTLFLDPLLTQDQLRSAFARQVSADSFQIVLPSRILGYRIPPSVTR
jgi:hypothetical protein